MLPKTQRLTKRETNLLLKKGETFHTPFFIVKKRKNHINEFRFCVITSKKVSPKATIRNRLKRQVYEAIRMNLSLLSPSLSGFDIILITKQKNLSHTFDTIHKSITSLFNEKRFTT